jgi:hypothetical protein
MSALAMCTIAALSSAWRACRFRRTDRRVDAVLQVVLAPSTSLTSRLTTTSNCAPRASSVAKGHQQPPVAAQRQIDQLDAPSAQRSARAAGALQGVAANFGELIGHRTAEHGDERDLGPARRDRLAAEKTIRS